MELRRAGPPAGAANTRASGLAERHPARERHRHLSPLLEAKQPCAIQAAGFLGSPLCGQRCVELQHGAIWQ
jgi:hypothetical protein